MAISEITEKLLAAKKAQGISFADLEKLLGRDEVWIAAHLPSSYRIGR